MASKRNSGAGTLFKLNGRGNWYAQWFDHRGKRCKASTRTTDKAAAQRILAKKTADAALMREGVVDPALHDLAKHADRPVSGHLEDYIRKLTTAGRSEKHIAGHRRAIEAAADAAGWTSAGDITADGLNQYASILRDQKRSAQTVKNHLTAVKAFTRWMLTHRKLAYDPLASVKLPNAKTDRRRIRRMLLAEEWTYLDRATRTGPEREGVSGTERALLYAVAIQTGLRANELRTLTVSRLHLHDDEPFILAKAKNTKNQRDARQYIRPAIAAELAGHVARKLPNAAVFQMPDEWKVADVLREDLAQARQQWLAEPAALMDPEERQRREESDFLMETNVEGESLDLHALRHTCGAWLAASGAHPNVVKSVMRHSSITLTMDTYGHLFPGEQAGATAAFDQLMPATVTHQQATGTAGQAPEEIGSSTGSNRGAFGREIVRADAKTSPPASAHASDEKPLKTAEKCEDVRRDAGGNGKATDRNRTGNLRFTKPLLCQLSYGGGRAGMGLSADRACLLMRSLPSGLVPL